MWIDQCYQILNNLKGLELSWHVLLFVWDDWNDLQKLHSLFESVVDSIQFRDHDVSMSTTQASLTVNDDMEEKAIEAEKK